MQAKRQNTSVRLTEKSKEELTALSEHHRITRTAVLEQLIRQAAINMRRERTIAARSEEDAHGKRTSVPVG